MDHKKLYEIWCENATEDYLTTLRNAVCSPVSNYSDYGVLYVLSSNRLESLTTASIDLQNQGMPLNTNYIRDNIKKKIEDCLMNANEKVYLRNSLDRISQRIGDGGYTLFDFKEILGVLKRGHLKDNFSTLGYFEDKDIYDMFFSQSEKDLQERVEKNAFLYNQISDIIAQTDGEERKVKLGKYLDDRLINDLARVESVNDIDFSNVAKSIDRKNAAATLSFEDVRVTREIKNNVNRKVNCETANLNKVVNASVNQINDINFIKKMKKFDELPEYLKEIARVRLEFPDMPLKDLGQQLDKPLGKSGVNHRLQKIHEIAEELRK